MDMQQPHQRRLIHVNPAFYQVEPSQAAPPPSSKLIINPKFFPGICIETPRLPSQIPAPTILPPAVPSAVKPSLATPSKNSPTKNQYSWKSKVDKSLKPSGERVVQHRSLHLKTQYKLVRKSKVPTSESPVRLPQLKVKTAPTNIPIKSPAIRTKYRLIRKAKATILESPQVKTKYKLIRKAKATILDSPQLKTKYKLIRKGKATSLDSPQVKTKYKLIRKSKSPRVRVEEQRQPQQLKKNLSPAKLLHMHKYKLVRRSLKCAVDSASTRWTNFKSSRRSTTPKKVKATPKKKHQRYYDEEQDLVTKEATPSQGDTEDAAAAASDEEATTPGGRRRRKPLGELPAFITL